MRGDRANPVISTRKFLHGTSDILCSLAKDGWFSFGCLLKSFFRGCMAGCLESDKNEGNFDNYCKMIMAWF